MKIIEDEKSKIVNLYKNGKTVNEIATIFNVSITPIYRILNEMHVKRRSSSDCHKKYTIDELYFDDINTHNKAYLYSDAISLIVLLSI